MNVTELITNSLQILGVVAPGESVPIESADVCLTILNDYMLGLSRAAITLDPAYTALTFSSTWPYLANLDGAFKLVLAEECAGRFGVEFPQSEYARLCSGKAFIRQAYGNALHQHIGCKMPSQFISRSTGVYPSEDV